MQAKNILNSVESTKKVLETAKKELDRSLAVLDSQVKQNKGKFSDENLSKFDKELNRVAELKKELNGLKNNK